MRFNTDIEHMFDMLLKIIRSNENMNINGRSLVNDPRNSF